MRGSRRPRSGHTAICWTQQLKIGGSIFHKKQIDTRRPGAAMADDLGPALDDVDGQRLVTCVLNTIDDALDRSDPAGTTWTADAVKHLEPVLARARAAGRIVVLTSDHGHVVERRRGRQVSRPDMSSARSRPADPPAGDGEVLVSGERVLAHDGRAVLAVDEDLRYGPLKAGYHGGAAPAEVVVPVIVLQPDPSDLAGLRLAPPFQPRWWTLPSASEPVAAAPAPPKAGRRGRQVAPDTPSLFDEVPLPSQEAARERPSGIGQTVVASKVFEAQRTLAGRGGVMPEEVTAFLDLAAQSSGGRIDEVEVAKALGVSMARLRGALASVQKLLNVDGYGVVTLDADGRTVVVDVALLKEQFGVRA